MIAPAFAVAAFACAAGGTDVSVDERIARELPSLEALYRELHANPELSYFEEKTAARVADELKKAGFEVTTGIGKYPETKPADARGAEAPKRGHGVVAVLKNGEGPTLLIRADLDALPVEEKTGLPYASKARGRNEVGDDVAVMHACGHDMHLTALVGTARVLAAERDRWRGTLVLVAQPAEERSPGGAEAMLRDGLYERFGKPAFALALHNDATREVGKVGWVSGFAHANSDTLDITVRGVGGHGASPQATKDPVVIASQIVLALQTIASRETLPGDPVVVTVGSIHGGTKHNIIPDEVRLQLTVRTYAKETRERVLASIERIVVNTARAAGVPKEREPLVDAHSGLEVPATYNDPALTERCVAAMRASLGEANVEPAKPVMGAEDFGRFALEDRSVPCFMFWLGSVDPLKVAESKKPGAPPLPSLHSSAFAPVPQPAMKTGVKAMAACALELLGKSR